MTYRPPTLRTLVATLAAFVVLATSCGGGSADTATEAVADAAAPTAQAEDTTTADATTEEAPAEASLVATTVGGGQIDFGSLEGQDVVLWFWAPW